MDKIKLINPVAKAMLQNRKRKQVVPDKKKEQAKKIAESKIKEYKNE